MRMNKGLAPLPYHSVGFLYINFLDGIVTDGFYSGWFQANVGDNLNPKTDPNHPLGLHTRKITSPFTRMNTNFTLCHHQVCAKFS